MPCNHGYAGSIPVPTSNFIGDYFHRRVIRRASPVLVHVMAFTPKGRAVHGSDGVRFPRSPHPLRRYHFLTASIKVLRIHSESLKPSRSAAFSKSARSSNLQRVRGISLSSVSPFGSVGLPTLLTLFLGILLPSLLCFFDYCSFDRRLCGVNGWKLQHGNVSLALVALVG